MANVNENAKLFNYSIITYPTGPADRTSLSRSRPLIRTYTPLPCFPRMFEASVCDKEEKKEELKS